MILDELPSPGPVTPIPDAGVPDVLAAIVRDLQVTPRRYRWFGAWWWPIKAMLRRAGFASQLPTLGSAMDFGALATLPAQLTPGMVLAEGLRHYQFAARLAAGAEWVDAPNGDRIRIHDPDVED